MESASATQRFLFLPTCDGDMKALMHIDFTGQDSDEEVFAGRAQTRTVTCSTTRVDDPHTTGPGCHVTQ